MDTSLGDEEDQQLKLESWLKSTPRMHTDSVFGILHTLRKIISQALVPPQNFIGVNGYHRKKFASRICHGAVTPSFWYVRPCTSWSPLGNASRVMYAPKTLLVHGHCFIRVRILLSSSFPHEIDIIHKNCNAKFDYCESCPQFLFLIVCVDFPFY